MSEEFKEHVKDVLAPLETTLANSATRLEEHHVASMEQHEKLVKDAHDFLAEALEQFKTALTKQVRVMERHNDRHEILKESTAALATSARKRFRDINTLGEDTSKDARTRRKEYAESMLARADEEHKKALIDGWIEERKAFHEKIKCMEEEYKKLKADREKLADQVSEHGVRNYKRGLKQVEEKAEVSRIGSICSLNSMAIVSLGLTSLPTERLLPFLSVRDFSSKTCSDLYGIWFRLRSLFIFFTLTLFPMK
jgi:hypothetical protein